MKKYLVMFIAVLAVMAVALPSHALELKYGGMFRIRLQSSDNLIDGTKDDIEPGINYLRDDNQNYIDQRLRMYFTFVSSENLQVVTKWESDVQWGEPNGASHQGGAGQGGAVGADAVNLEMKNAYVDFAIPNTPVRVKAGVQGLGLLDGWIISDDFSAAVASAKFDPVTVSVGYVAGLNQGVTDKEGDIDDVFINIAYAHGHFKAGLTGFYQDAHDTVTGVVGFEVFGAQSWPSFLYPAGWLQGYSNHGNGAVFTGANNELFDLGINLEYKEDVWSAYLNFVKNFGGWDSQNLFGTNYDDSYNGWMIEARGNYYCGPFTFTLGAFYTSGSDIDTTTGYADDPDNYFRYPAGVSHYWSEILGLGTLDASTGNGAGDHIQTQYGYSAADHPSNLWMINVGAAWQALEGTKLTFNYYYVGVSGDAISGINPVTGLVETDDTIGHEIDFYLDQNIVDKLNLRLVGAYLIADDAYTSYNNDDDTYELGAQLLWAF